MAGCFKKCKFSNLTLTFFSPNVILNCILMFAYIFRLLSSFLFFFFIYFLQLFGLVRQVPQINQTTQKDESCDVLLAKKKKLCAINKEYAGGSSALSELCDETDFEQSTSIFCASKAVELSTQQASSGINKDNVVVPGSTPEEIPETKLVDDQNTEAVALPVDDNEKKSMKSVRSERRSRRSEWASSPDDVDKKSMRSNRDRSRSTTGDVDTKSMRSVRDRSRSATGERIGDVDTKSMRSVQDRSRSTSGERTDSTGPKAYVEGVVCNERELEENSMKVCELGEDGKVLVVKQKGQIKAVGTKCTHYGAPMVAGALGEGRIRCPWHGACFSLETGDIEDFPGLDSLPCYKVTVNPNGDIYVRAKKSDLEANRRLKDMGCRDCSNKSTFVIVGGGGAGECCAETLRQEGFSGRLLMITNEASTPYDRVKLSKQMDATPDKIVLRPESFYKEHDIEVMLNSPAVSICTLSKKVTLENGTYVGFDKIFLCTGSDPRRVDLPGADLGNIFTLRNIADTSAIYKTLSPESEVVIYGSSFIGMEAAAYCVSRVKSVTVVGRSKVPFKASLGEDVGRRLAKVFQDKGIKLELGNTITSFSGDGTSGVVKQCTLSDGRTIPASTVILGLGTVPATNFIVHSQIKLNDDGTVPVNEFLETNCPGVYAGGDIAYAPVMANNNQPASIGHWQLAHYHGRIAALNMLNKRTALETVPFFWTMLFGLSYRYAGYARKYDDVIIGGSLDDLKFAAYYCNGDDVLAVCTAGTDPIAANFAERLSEKKKLTKRFISNNLLEWYKTPI